VKYIRNTLDAKAGKVVDGIFDYFLRFNVFFQIRTTVFLSHANLHLTGNPVPPYRRFRPAQIFHHKGHKEHKASPAGPGLFTPGWFGRLNSINSELLLE